MNAETQIKNKLFKNLGLKKVDILNNSHLHNNHNSSPKSGKSHFKIIIKDKDLFRLPRIKSHQKIYTCLSDELKSFIHALEIEIINS